MYSLLANLTGDSHRRVWPFLCHVFTPPRMSELLSSWSCRPRDDCTGFVPLCETPLCPSQIRILCETALYLSQLWMVRRSGSVSVRTAPTAFTAWLESAVSSLRFHGASGEHSIPENIRLEALSADFVRYCRRHYVSRSCATSQKLLRKNINLASTHGNRS